MKGMKADKIIVGNAIFTGLNEKPFSGFIAIKDSKIFNVGEHATTYSKWVDKHTEIIHAHDSLVLPGFHDFHLHLWLGAMFETFCNLTFCSTEEEAAKAVYEYSQLHPQDEWIIGFGWHHVRWPNQELPTRHSLDAVLPDRPVVLLNEEAHSAWLNSAALQKLGIHENTEEPPFGEIVKDENGQPTGFLYETAVKLATSAFSFTEEEHKQLFETFLHKAARLGVTSVGDMLPLPGYTLGDPNFYQSYDEQEGLTVRIHFQSPLNGELEEAKRLRKDFHSEKIQFGGLKQFLDGVPLTYTGYLLEPYSDRPQLTGGTIYDFETYQKWIDEADKEEFRIRLHACGDAAVRMGLDLFEHAQSVNGVRDSRHTIEHIEVISPDDIPRFQQLGVIASIQPDHLTSSSMDTHAYIERLGAERCRYTWPIGSLMESGATVAFGTDFPIVELNPMVGLYRAVTRRHEDGTPENGWNPKERISLCDAIKQYTIAPAFGQFREDELGTLEAGKFADIIILDRNIFERDVEEILETKVTMTIMNGDVVYKSE